MTQPALPDEPEPPAEPEPELDDPPPVLVVALGLADGRPAEADFLAVADGDGGRLAMAGGMLTSAPAAEVAGAVEWPLPDRDGPPLACGCIAPHPASAAIASALAVIDQQWRVALAVT